VKDRIDGLLDEIEGQAEPVPVFDRAPLFAQLDDLAAWRPDWRIVAPGDLAPPGHPLAGTEDGRPRC
jgi:hypothetical protein